MAMASNEPTRAKMAQLRMACEQEIRACRERYGLLATSIRESIKSIKALVENAQINRGNLAKLKDHLKELEDSFRYALKVNASKDAKHTSISEAISAMVVRIEHLKKTVDDQRAKKDEYEAVLSRQLLALQTSEEKHERDLIEIKKLKEATDWYKSVLGFKTEGGEGVKFTFNKIDPNDQEKEYWFIVRLDGGIYSLLHCNPEVNDIDELMKELNRTNGLFKFVRDMREKFQEILCADTHSNAMSAPPSNSMDSQTEMSIENNRSLQSKKHQAGCLHDVVPTSTAILTPQSVSTFRRSPRFLAKKLP
ncbi:kinetochore protein spc25 [Phalaenopsis equestris]|uniref:kinetochore protein spc25 n=1 Tax=Phalaenopsis equestris TaxID=78828 RepID=UPI0009E45FAE|nr:kinetochore protein spc25 [Phalaenopsis equestris]